MRDPRERGKAGHLHPRGTFAHYTWKPADADHTVCIVGWDDDYAVSNFNSGRASERDENGTTVTYDMAPPRPGAWIVKNSWGKRGGTDRKGDQVLGDYDFGVDGSGYFYLSYYDQSVTSLTSYSFVQDMVPGETVAHQYDYPPAQDRFLVEDASELCGANVFHATGDETLTSVATITRRETYDARVKYAAYRLRKGWTTPTDGEPLDTLECLYANPGYHREVLDRPIALKAGESFSVVVTQTFQDAPGKTLYAISASANPSLTEPAGL